MVEKRSYVWLSHSLSPSTPAYRGGQSLLIVNEKCIQAGDTCNSASLSMPNHLGSHVDAPRHFIASGLSVTDYGPHDWIFSKPQILDVSPSLNSSINYEDLIKSDLQDNESDLVLLRTGFEAFRDQPRYWNEQLPFHPDLATGLMERFPKLRAVGVDTISVSTPQNREFGKEIHLRFLRAGVRIFEDLSLAHVPAGGLRRVIALPLRIDGIDGGPCTIVGELSEDR